MIKLSSQGAKVKEKTLNHINYLHFNRMSIMLIEVRSQPIENEENVQLQNGTRKAKDFELPPIDAEDH